MKKSKKKRRKNQITNANHNNIEHYRVYLCAMRLHTVQTKQAGGARELWLAHSFRIINSISVRNAALKRIGGSRPVLFLLAYSRLFFSFRQ